MAAGSALSRAPRVGAQPRRPQSVGASRFVGAVMDNGVLIAAEGFRARWTDVQTGFVDAPRRAVEQTDALVAELMQHLARTFADGRGRLESQWDLASLSDEELQRLIQLLMSERERRMGLEPGPEDPV